MVPRETKAMLMQNLEGENKEYYGGFRSGLSEYHSMHRIPKIRNCVLLNVECNRPVLSSCLPPLQSESKCEGFLLKISFHSYVK